MPVYEYKCTVCQQHFDVEQSFTEDALTSMEGCEVDGGGDHRLKKVFSAVGISFKGDGFYRNDARSGSSGSSSSSSNGGNGDSTSSSSSESKKTDAGSGSGSSKKESTASTSSSKAAAT